MYANGYCVLKVLGMERESERVEDFGLSFHQSHRQTLHSRVLGLERNMEKVLPANYSAVASCGPDSSWDCRRGLQTPDAPRSRRGREFCYHINSICRQRKT